MKTLNIKGQIIKAKVLIGSTQELISESKSINTYLALAEVNDVKVSGLQHVSGSNGRLNVSYTFDGIKFPDNHKKIAEYIYQKYIL